MTSNATKRSHGEDRVVPSFLCSRDPGAMSRHRSSPRDRAAVGKGRRYRYYTCSIKARQGETGCKGRSIPMEKLDNLVGGHIEDCLL